MLAHLRVIVKLYAWLLNMNRNSLLHDSNVMLHSHVHVFALLKAFVIVMVCFHGFMRVCASDCACWIRSLESKWINDKAALGGSCSLLASEAAWARRRRRTTFITTRNLFTGTNQSPQPLRDLTAGPQLAGCASVNAQWEVTDVAVVLLLSKESKQSTSRWLMSAQNT